MAAPFPSGYETLDLYPPTGVDVLRLVSTQMTARLLDAQPCVVEVPTVFGLAAAFGSRSVWLVQTTTRPNPDL